MGVLLGVLEAVVPFSLWQKRLLCAWKFGALYVFGMQRTASAA